MFDPHRPSSRFGDKHIMSAIFEPIKDDVKPLERTAGHNESHVISGYAQMDAPENPNMAFGQKAAPVPDNLMLAAIHNLLHKNSLASMNRDIKRKGISNVDIETTFMPYMDEEFDGENSVG